MISPSYYIKDRKVQFYLGGKISHYVVKPRAKILGFVYYTVQAGDTLYSIAAKLFDVQGEYNWTIIADLNYLRKPDELQVGEVIKLPTVILNETEARLPRYEQNTSTAIKV